MVDNSRQKKETCHLKECLHIEGWCTRESCVFWRLLEPQDADISNDEGCGLTYFGVVQGIEPEVARWLLAMKEKLENTSPEKEKARITFRRRES